MSDYEPVFKNDDELPWKREFYERGWRDAIEAAAKMMEAGSWHPKRVAMVRALTPKKEKS